MYLLSNNVTVFPVAKNRKDVANGGRLFTEEYVSNLIRQLIDSNGFIIENSYDSGSAIDDVVNLKFNLHGYYFDVRFTIQELIDEYNQTNTLTGTKYVYAIINIDSATKELNGQDEYLRVGVKSYTGLEIKILDTNPSSGEYLKLFDIIKNGSNITVSPSKESYQKFNPTSLLITEIDGKC